MTKRRNRLPFACLALGMSAIAMPASAATARQSVFGEMPDGKSVEAVVLTGLDGASLAAITPGAMRHAFSVPDWYGRAADITVGPDTVADYLDQPNSRGQAIGRNADRIHSSNFLDGTREGKDGKARRMGDASALEPQVFPDTPNQPDFGSARLDPGKTYRHTMTYRVSTPD